MPMPLCELRGRPVGPGQPVYIVAEVGGNHNGDLDVARNLIEAAKEAGCDAVKFQKRTPELAIPKHMQGAARETPWGTMTYLEYRQRLEFGLEEYQALDEHCHRLGIPWFASVWDEESVAFMGQFATPCIKVPSACLTDHSLLRCAAGSGLPLVISTGMSTSAEIADAVALLFSLRARFILCHCNSTYPCPPGDLNLRCITTLQKGLPNVPIGYSGHEVGLATTVAAVALGACYVERHITLDRSMWGTDQAASVEPGGMARLVKDIRNVEKALGDGVKRVTQGELPVMARLRRVQEVV